MSVRKDEPMDHLAATDEEFDALLEASSLGAPHVVAETGDIPAAARRRMAQAIDQQRQPCTETDDASSPQTSDRTDSSHEAARTASAAQWAHRRPSLAVLFGTYSSGKSSIAAALCAWLHSAHSDAGRSSRRESPVPKSWVEPRAMRMIWTARWLTVSPGGNAGRSAPLPWVSHGGSTAPCKWQCSPLTGGTAQAPLRSSTFGETQMVSTAVPACAHAARMFWLSSVRSGPSVVSEQDCFPHTFPALSVSGCEGSWRYSQGLRNLRYFVESWPQPEGCFVNVTPAGLLVHAAPVTRLHVETTTTWAYTAVDGGLLVPKGNDVSHHSLLTRENRTPGGVSGRLLRTGRTKLRQAVVDGVAELSTELPMLVHSEVRESLALTSSLRTRLTYRVSDPYAVEARFRADDQGETVWTFARDLLRNGLEQRDGLGDVRVWPDADLQEEPRVFIRLSSPEGAALLSAADADLRGFLEAASSLVAYGDEYAHLLPALSALETTIGELARPGRCD